MSNSAAAAVGADRGEEPGGPGADGRGAGEGESRSGYGEHHRGAGDFGELLAVSFRAKTPLSLDRQEIPRPSGRGVPRPYKTGRNCRGRACPARNFSQTLTFGAPNRAATVGSGNGTS